MNNELCVRINIISKPAEYWTTNDPVLAIGEAAHVIGQDASIIRVGDGVSHYSKLKETHIDAFVSAHAGIHAADGRDPLLATNAELSAGTTTQKAITVKQFADALGGNVTLPKFTISAGAATGTGTPNQLWFQYIA